ncbi:hypothetical protein V8G54_011375 [Vigna mungo]|uniref:Uncharacterized protein n=1 Tax=Vigna mungo TaxID=3915 RepID=A0AAQ3RZJ7_VIGMU
MSAFFLASAASTRDSNSRSCVYSADSGSIAATLSCSCFSGSFCFFLREAGVSSIGLKGEKLLGGENPTGRIGGFRGIRFPLALPGVEIADDSPKLPKPPPWF